MRELSDAVRRIYLAQPGVESFDPDAPTPIGVETNGDGDVGYHINALLDHIHHPIEKQTGHLRIWVRLQVVSLTPVVSFANASALSFRSIPLCACTHTSVTSQLQSSS